MRTTFSRISGMTADQRTALTEQFDKASRIASAEPVAVVGVGCRFPGGVVGPEGYWTFLANGGDAISEIPSERWDADAFYDPDPFAPGRMSSKWGGFLPDVAGFDAYSATGNAHAVAVGRIAYLLGLRGPAMAVDSACSSSLVAVHLACQSLRLRETDLALAGGVSLILR